LRLIVCLKLPDLAMTRLLSIVLLASFVAGSAAAGAPGLPAGGSQAVLLSQGSGDSDGPMAGTGCDACAAMGACIATGPVQAAGIEISRLQPLQPSSQLSDQVRAPETAPPKRSSI
jgi:hypothetical protein